MDRLAEGIFFREIVRHRNYDSTIVSIANGELPQQKRLICQWPADVCETDWLELVSMNICGDDLEGNGYDVTFKKPHKDMPLFIAYVTQHSKPLLEGMIEDMIALVTGNRVSVTWTVPVDAMALKAASESAIRSLNGSPIRKMPTRPFSDKEKLRMLKKL